MKLKKVIDCKHGSYHYEDSKGGWQGENIQFNSNGLLWLDNWKNNELEGFSFGLIGNYRSYAVSFCICCISNYKQGKQFGLEIKGI